MKTASKLITSNHALFLVQFKGKTTNESRVHLGGKLHTHEFAESVSLDNMLAQHIKAGQAEKIETQQLGDNLRITLEGGGMKFSYLACNMDAKKLVISRIDI